ncbi:hypothetical protein FHU10_1450 [Serratia fonticola]|uniref:Uncharacterized protein n=1 Tax=Serratia fonticola TaxID=47917 RepID=A0A559T301_SERFO|nr:hypothetical protein FHU11_5052 [Serratia fonticola]TVZ68986.1 hypothetical protein FHU10_1450 [Serratia fonticola]
MNNFGQSDDGSSTVRGDSEAGDLMNHGRGLPRLRLLTKREKAWFFPLCDDQPKINKLIFLIYFLMLPDISSLV